MKIHGEENMDLNFASFLCVVVYSLCLANNFLSTG